MWLRRLEMQNHRILFLRRPTGLPVPEDFSLEAAPISSPGAGQFLARTVWLSLDPYYRNVMKGHPIYGIPLEPGEVMFGKAVAQVAESRHPDFVAGEYVLMSSGWQQWALSDGKDVEKVDPEAAPLSTALGAMGMPGLTGYAGLVYLGEPRPGQTVVVSAATGGVGTTVGQVARLMGARPVGIAGSSEKCDYAVRELGYTACINYRTGDLKAQLKEACPRGIDVYFDNVGGEVLSAVLGNLALHARIVLCGMPEVYNMAMPPPGPFLGPVIGARATMKGLVVYDWLARMPEMRRIVGEWIRDGRFQWREDITEGITNAPDAFCRLMRGENFGKALVRVAPERC
ncbi:MAG: NADP-dependent oxidoreductase [Steroidobacteraceae bacterium]|jgi:NADPH-dependent curcumin reductase CurA